MKQRRWAKVTLALLTGLSVLSTTAHAKDTLAPPYPVIGAGTAFLDHAALLAGLPEQGWFDANIPLVDLPDPQIQEIYYYRWKVFHEALKYTGAKDGWIVSEFLGPVGYSAPNGGIVAAAGHHVYEGRWLRDTRYLDDYLRYWLRGPGAGYKPPTDFLNDHATDWAHQYSTWLADAAVARASVTGDWRFATDLLPELQKHWDKWSPQYDTATGMYWQTPVWDAMEYTASSYQSPDPYHGGHGFRPTVNSYQIADATAIATLAKRVGDTTTAQDFTGRASRLSAAQQQWLWDPDAKFYKHVMRDDNPGRVKIADRELMGYVPWAFHTAPASNAEAWAQLTDSQGFDAQYGPPTAERRSQWFMYEAYQGCCRWNGPSWPYATSQTLTGLANLLIDYPGQSYVDKDDYYTGLRRYALTQYKDGQPHVAEAHDPDQPRWMYDSYNHSEDYNHSTYTDLVLSGLLGIRPQQDESVVLHPLVPSDWDHFAVENLAYHGRNLTILWDRDGTRYHQGRGLSVYLDGRRVTSRPDLSPLRISVPDRPLTPLPRMVDDAANVSGNGYPAAIASYANTEGAADDTPQQANDGQNFFLDIPTTRWTTYRSPSSEDWLAIDFGALTTVSDVRLYFYDDGGGVKPPASYRLQYRRGNGTWADIPGQTRSSATPRGDDLNRITFPPQRTTGIRVLGTPQPGSSFGLTAIQSWRVT